MNIGYELQNKVVVQRLVENHGYSMTNAIRLWYKSKTRHVIQEEIHGDWVSPARCLAELIMEINHDPMWNTDIYD